ncbi:kinase, PfkB family protein [Entamoeba histolytica HM-1:IMSS-B]|uniref:Kinase, PfkB family n=5 Tax=Entamoeba histolytica TaxID=5759 RepID=C4MAP6_ENTH1|nr:kinase, PfkB family [Entamoeba histolytica HM-1:IMSS]EMD48004.1 kinase PfkB family protein [Entamoeba histolytica KU27]EMH77203.1 kinase, PfkB family protein [Entamoeba histolytica HM-1:IMSS-B]EMS15378.1 kinase, PfkB family protein [Entamoeba histolytica HM-3:IMSS]GAT98899.1 kinase pfkb family [Entamoeba histolytica]EAL47659.1 kinase, PfkB family [Entamoeba histolytica HM-1:IMSS]|eukprot:XP_653045.1 kinase, PfkB family [Entamoeba histolytica HM-1:IMSS]
MAKVLGIGNALLDLLMTVPDDVLNELELAKGSMEMITEEKNKRILEVTKQYPKMVVSGGSASNCIHAIAHLGGDCTFQGKIGKDANGEAFSEDCKKSGITPKLTVTDLATGCANTFVTADGERTFGTFLGAACTLGVDDIKSDIMKGMKLLHTEGYLIFNTDMFRKMMQTAKAEGVTISLDAGSFNIINDFKSFFDELLKDYVDIIFCNEEESEALTGLSDPYQAIDALAKLVKVPVVKLGKNGSLVKVNGKTVKVDIFKADKIVDTTGAGDSYAGTFLAGWLRGIPEDKCAKAASFISSKVIQKMGAKLTEEQWAEYKVEVEKIFA